MPPRAAVPLLAACLACLAAGPAPSQEAAKPLFREGTCSGLLCDYIGGAQAPAAEPQRSLFREGQCGGVLCDAIGGAQAPAHAEAPPPCGGGILCEMMPYKMGVPVTAAEAARLQAERAREAALPPPAAGPAEGQRAPHRRGRKRHGADQAAAD